MKLSLGPNFFYWPRGKILDFYEQVGQSAIDIIHVGEVICSKRREMSPNDWLDLARHLKSTGKEVVLSSLTLLEAASELGAMRRLCRIEEFLIEANDIAAVNLLSRNGMPFSTGPSVNVYNNETLKTLVDLGLCRWVLPVELGADTLAEISQRIPEGVETEVFGFGRLPLAYSARCFTARADNLPKDRCDFRCLDYPDGQILRTRENDPFLVINGIQTLSALTHSIADDVHVLPERGVDVVRISPQAEHTAEIIALFDALRRGDDSADPQQLHSWMPVGSCRGYWHARAGLEN